MLRLVVENAKYEGQVRNLHKFESNKVKHLIEDHKIMGLHDFDKNDECDIYLYSEPASKPRFYVVPKERALAGVRL